MVGMTTETGSRRLQQVRLTIGPLSRPDTESLLRRNVRRLHALRSTLGFVADFLVFRERLEAIASNFREVGEEIIAASVRRNKTEALRIVKPFNCTDIHDLP